MGKGRSCAREVIAQHVTVYLLALLLLKDSKVHDRITTSRGPTIAFPTELQAVTAVVDGISRRSGVSGAGRHMGGMKSW